MAQLTHDDQHRYNGNMPPPGNKSPQNVSRWLSGTNQAAHLVRMVNQQQKLLSQIRSILPPDLQQHCLHARIDQNRLILFTDSPAWNARLRYFGNNLLRQIRQQAPSLQSVQIKIFVQAPTKWPTRRKARLSPKSAETILDTASVTSDSQLRAALSRLGRHVGEKTPD
ncbi:MAG: DUF721 domain-containing protein [bacterium]